MPLLSRVMFSEEFLVILADDDDEGEGDDVSC